MGVRLFIAWYLLFGHFIIIVLELNLSAVDNFYIHIHQNH